MGRPILTPHEMREAETRVISAGTPGIELMQRAGAAVAGALHSRFPQGRVRVLCGPGGNGGDGFIAAERLAALGHEVEVFALRPIEALSGDPARAAAIWGRATAPLDAAVDRPHDITLDALFGGGLSRPLSGAAADLAQGVGPVVSVDVPSGLDGLTGRPLGPCFRADLTVTFAALRPGHVLLPGRGLCGQLEVAEIGVPARSSVRENAEDDWLAAFPFPGEDTHKHKRGRLVCVTGGLSQTGAARLCARAGLRIGAGLVTLACPPSATMVLAFSALEELVTSFATPGDLARLIETAHCVVIGPAAGLTPATRENVAAVLAGPGRAVLDADALTLHRDAPGELFSRLREGDVLTPHEGEFERLFPGLLEAAENRIDAARQAARRAGCVIVLKGATSLIAAPDGQVRANCANAPWLASAGTGDVLAGMIGGLLAQGMASFEAACAGVWLHAEAGRQAGPGLIASDVIAGLPPLLQRLHEARSKKA